MRYVKMFKNQLKVKIGPIYSVYGTYSHFKSRKCICKSLDRSPPGESPLYILFTGLRVTIFQFLQIGKDKKKMFNTIVLLQSLTLLEFELAMASFRYLGRSFIVFNCVYVIVEFFKLCLIEELILSSRDHYLCDFICFVIKFSLQM